MEAEIEAVKKEILDIINEVNAGGISPSIYILGRVDLLSHFTKVKCDYWT